MLSELDLLSLSKGFSTIIATEGSKENRNMHGGHQQNQVQKITDIYFILVQAAE